MLALRWFAFSLAIVAANTSMTRGRVTRTIGAPNVVTTIRNTERWTANTRYVLAGRVVVAAGGTLVIEPGTRVEGAVGTALVIDREARIIADGTLLQPIVMSCTATTKFSGCWDGVVINGYAPINMGTMTSPAPRGAGATGCLESTDAFGGYGGCDAADSSGVLRYVRVEYATDGIRLRGVGRKTLFDFVEVLRTWGDGIALAGGSVNLRHGVISASGDAGLAWRNGWVGDVQFLLLQQDPANFRAAIRGENDATNPDALPRSAPSIFNATVVAQSSPTNPNAALPPRAVWLTAGTAGRLRNLIVHRAHVALDIDGSVTCAQLASGALALTNTAFTGATQLGDNDADATACAPLTSPSVEQQLITAAPNANLVLTTPLEVDSVFRDGGSLMLPDLRLRTGKPVATGVNFAAPPNDGFFDVTALYYGAIRPALVSDPLGVIPWYSGWTIGAPLSGVVPGGTIAGVISAPGLGGISGVTVSSPGAQSATSNATGTFTLLVPAGYATLTVSNLPVGCASVAPIEVVVRPGATSTQPITLDCSPPPRAIAAGGEHTCAIGTTLLCWGTNTAGALGDGTTIERSTPVHPSTAPVLARVTAGTLHSCGLTAAGAAWCWGANTSGQLGDGGTNNRLAPTIVSGGVVFSRIAAGGAHTCALTPTNVAYCWGSGGQGQIGTGANPATVTAPTMVGGGLVFREIVTGDQHTCGLTPAGTAYCWGANANGQLGIGTTTAQNVPTVVAGNLTFVDLGAGTNHTCGITTTGDAYCWGLNASGQLGDGGTAAHLSPARVSTTTTLRQIEAGGAHTCALTTSDTALCWGANTAGQLGDGTLSDRLLPVPVLGGTTYRELDAGAQHSCAISTANDVICWGSDVGAQIGQGGGRFRRIPVSVSGSLVFASVTAGERHSCGVTSNGAGYCWGANVDGQLGDGSIAMSRAAPTLVAGGHVFAKISAGAGLTCGIEVAGPAYCWGTGALGAGSAGISRTPQLVSGGLMFADIAVGDDHVCAVASDGGGYCWGANASGQLGNGATTDKMVPTHTGGVMIVNNEVVVVNPTFVKITVGASHSCGVTPSSAAYCWGANANGQLGTGTLTTATLPTMVSGPFAFAQIDAGAQHTCAITTTNQGVCWGSDAAGQLGDGTAGGISSAPSAIAGTTTFSQITAGAVHSCGVTTTGIAQCWGGNDESQLGDGSATSRATPLAVANGGGYSGAGAGAHHSCGVRAGAAVCWGSNEQNQIGDGLSAAVTVPIVVVPGAGSAAFGRRRAGR